MVHDVQIRCHDKEVRGEMLEELGKLCAQIEVMQGNTRQDGEVFSFLVMSLDDDWSASLRRSREGWEDWQREFSCEAGVGAFVGAFRVSGASSASYLDMGISLL